MMHYGLIVLRALSAFFIVGSHLNLTPRTWLGGCVSQYGDVAVAMFGCISGFLLIGSCKRALDSCSDLRGVALKRFSRLMPMYCLWTMIYLLFGAAYDVAINGRIEDKFLRVGFWIDTFFHGGASCHLWFVIDLFYISMFVVVVLSLVRWACSVWFWASLSVGLLMLTMSSNSNLSWYLIRLASFVCLGGAIGFSRQKVISSLWGWGCVGSVMVIAFYGCLPVHQFVRDAAIVLPFIMFMLSERGEAVSSRLLARFPMLNHMAVVSTGVYLIHPIICAGLGVAVMRRFVRPPFSVFAVMLDWSCSYLISLVLVSCLYKVGAAWLFGEISVRRARG